MTSRTTNLCICVVMWSLQDAFTPFISFNPCNYFAQWVIIPILQMRKLRLKVVKCTAWGLMAREWQRMDSVEILWLQSFELFGYHHGIKTLDLSDKKQIYLIVGLKTCPLQIHPLELFFKSIIFKKCRFRSDFFQDYNPSVDIEPSSSYMGSVELLPLVLAHILAYSTPYLALKANGGPCLGALFLPSHLQPICLCLPRAPFLSRWDITSTLLSCLTHPHPYSPYYLLPGVNEWLTLFCARTSDPLWYCFDYMSASLCGPLLPASG